MYSVHRLHSS